MFKYILSSLLLFSISSLIAQTYPRTDGSYDFKSSESDKNVTERLIFNSKSVYIQRSDNPDDIGPIELSYEENGILFSFEKYGMKNTYFGEMIDNKLIITIKEANIERTYDYKPFENGAPPSSISLDVPEIAEEENNEEIFTIVEVMPQFPGGINNLTEYIETNLKYPESAYYQIEGFEEPSEKEGRIYVSFVVEIDGSITNVKIMRGMSDCPDCNAETVRLIQNMPNWEPGIQRGEKVRVAYNYPVRFKKY